MADEERLVILLEAKLNQLEKNMAKASGVTARAYREMSLGSKRATTQMEADAIRSSLRVNQALAASSAKIGAYGRSFTAGALAPVAGLLTLTAAINGTRAALDRFGDLNDKTIASGLNSDLFQSLAYEAKLAGVEIDGAGAALAAFNKRVGDAAQGRGELVTALKNISPALAEQVKTAKTTEEAFRAVSAAMKNARTDAERASIAAASFGDSGIKLANAWAMTSDEIDQTVAKAQRLGIVVDRELIEKADQYGDEWDTAAEIINTKVAIALTNLAPGMVWLVDKAAQFAQFMNDATSGQKPMFSPSWGDQAEQHLGDVLRGLAYPDTSVSGLPRRYSEGQYDFGDMSGFFNGATREALDKLRAQAATSTNGGGSTSPSDFDFRGFLDTYYRDSLEGYPDLFRDTTSTAKTTTAAIYDNADAITELSQRWQTAEDMAQSFGATFLSSMRSGKTAVEALIDSLTGLADQAANMLMQQGIQSLFGLLSGGLTGGFGSIAGGAAIPAGGFIPGITGPRLFANGGISDRPAIFGERGPEAAVPLPDGRSIPVKLQGGRGDVINVNITGSRQDAAPIAREVEAVVHKVITQRQRNPYRR